MEVPHEIKTRLLQISQYSKNPVDVLIGEYLNYYNSVALQKFDEQRKVVYALRFVINRFAMRPPLEPHGFIPLGFSGLYTRKGNYFYDIYGIVSDYPSKVSRLVLALDTPEKVPQFNLFHLYQDLLIAKFSPTSEDYRGDERTVFSNPIPLPKTPDEIISGLGIPVVKISDAANRTSRLLSYSDKQYYDTTDWRAIEGTVSRTYRGERKDGTEFAVINIIDETVMLGESNSFTVWCPPELSVLEPNDICLFLGALQKDRKNGIPFLNCYNIIPILKGVSF